MKITDIKQYHVDVNGKILLMVVVESDEGIYGVGEATLRAKVPAVSASINILKESLIGKDPFQLERHFHELFYQDRWRNGVITNTALTGIEMAVYDLLGKQLGIPVYNLLGGKVRDKVMLYVNGWQDLDGKPSAENAARMKNEGYKAMKWNPLREIDVFRDDYYVEMNKVIDEAIKEVAHVRDAVGPEIELFVECHGRLSYDEALKFARGIEPYRIGFLEEPVQPDNIQAYQKLSQKIDIPLAAGERSFTRWGHRQVYMDGYLSIAQPDFTHCGGLMEAKKMSTMAETFYLKIAPHNSSGPLATIASAQVGSTLPNYYLQEFVYQKNFDMNRKYFKKGLNIQDGYLILDESPGLGVELDFEALKNDHVG